MNATLSRQDARLLLNEVSERGWAVFSDNAVKANDFDAMAAIARLFGNPSSRDNGPLWPIARRGQSGTFSETSEEASFHTDAQYRAQPEPLFVLFCVRPAACGGGRNRMLALRDVLATIENLSPSDVRSLRASEWSWKVPEVFAQNPDDSAVNQPVLGLHDIRWRQDNLLQPDVEQIATAERFAAFLHSHPRVTELKLSAGEVLVCDNRRALHARTKFSDPDRLLYRTRLW